MYYFAAKGKYVNKEEKKEENNNFEILNSFTFIYNQ